MADLVKQILAKLIQLTDQVIKAADEAAFFKRECAELKSKIDNLTGLLRLAARASNDLYERPAHRILDETEHILNKALALVLKCREPGLVKRVLIIIPPAAAFRKMSSQLENTIGDVSWLLRISSASAGDRDDVFLGFPPIAYIEPILYLVWEQIAILYTGSLEDRSDAAASLVSLARDKYRYRKLIIEEGGVVPLLNLVKEGKLDGQENAARAIGLLGGDPESVEHLIHAGACFVFAKILKEGSMKVQAVVAWAVAELVSHYPKCQDLFVRHNVIQYNIIRLLVGHLAFKTVQEHRKYAVVSKATSMHQAVVLASNINGHTTISANEMNDLDDDRSEILHQLGNKRMHIIVTNSMALKGQANQDSVAKSNGSSISNDRRTLSLSGASNKAREMEDPATKAYMKAMAARALWHLAKGNSSICKTITESRALLCFAVLLEKGPKEVQYNSAMALMEITAVAEEDADLRRSAFKPNSPACKAVVDQILRIIEKGDQELCVPCIKSIGNLARTFRATETRIISPLVKLLDEQEPEVSREACIGLTKFASVDNNYLYLGHSKSILSEGGAKHLVQLVYFGEQIVQGCALILLCYISLNVPHSEELAQADVLTVLEWASKQASLIRDENVKKLLPEAKGRLELYQSRGSTGFR